MKKEEDINNIKTLNHRLNNILGMSESSMNRLKNADVKTMDRRWATLRDVIIVTGRDRINKEIALFRHRKKIIEKISTETYVDVYEQLLMTDKFYKAMFDMLDNSKEHSEEAMNASLVYGSKMVCLLKYIINRLEIIRIGLQKI